MTTTKRQITDRKIIYGNMFVHEQRYHYEFIPPEKNFNAKLSLSVDTDVKNSLRFSSSAQALEFCEDSIYSLIKFLEYTHFPDYKEKFRLANLEEILKIIRNNIIQRFKNDSKRTLQVQL